MARHRRRHSRRRYGSMVSIPGLGYLPKSADTNDLILGAALGLGGTLVMKGLGNKLLAGTAPDWLLKGSPLVGGVATGALLYMIEGRKNRQKAGAHMLGAVLAGASVQAWDVLKTQFPEGLGDVVSLRFSNYGRGGRYGSVIVDERTPMVGPGGGASYAGLIVDEPGRSLSDTNLAQLAQVDMGLGDSDASGIEELMDMDD